VNVVNTMISQNLGAGLYLHGGQQVNVVGNSFDGNGGPGVFAVGEAALTISSCYFEDSCDPALSGHEPMVLVPHEETNWRGGSNVTVRADIVLSGEPDLGVYGASYPSFGVVVSGNAFTALLAMWTPRNCSWDPRNILYCNIYNILYILKIVQKARERE
jgi:hypothetical protein